MYTVDSLLTGNWTDLADSLRHLVLPASVLGCYTLSLITRFSRASVLDVLGQEYVFAAVGKGCPLGPWCSATCCGPHCCRS